MTEKAGHQEAELPKAVLKRLIKSKLQEYDKSRGGDGTRDFQINKEALLAFSEASKLFIHYLTSMANDICKDAKRQTVNAEDVLKALADMDFEEFVGPLKEALEAFKTETREKNKQKAEASKKRKAEAEAAEAEAAQEQQAPQGNDDSEHLEAQDAPKTGQEGDGVQQQPAQQTECVKGHGPEGQDQDGDQANGALHKNMQQDAPAQPEQLVQELNNRDNDPIPMTTD